MIITQRVDLVLMLISVLLVKLWLGQHRDIRLLANIGRLPDTNAIALVSVFCLQGVSSIRKFGFCHAKYLIGTFGNINHTFFIYFFFQGIGNIFSTFGFLVDISGIF